jgi:hypothetical protein
MLRTLRTDPERLEVVHIAASEQSDDGSEAHTMSRSSGASVVLVNGRLPA